MAAKLGSFDQDLVVGLWVYSNVVVQLGGVSPLGLPAGQGADQSVQFTDLSMVFEGNCLGQISRAGPSL